MQLVAWQGMAKKEKTWARCPCYHGRDAHATHGLGAVVAVFATTFADMLRPFRASPRGNPIPRALPWAGMLRPFRANSLPLG